MASDADAYTWVFTVSGLANLERETTLLARTLQADGAGGSASVLRNAYFELLRELRGIARDIAKEVDKSIKDFELFSRVRGHGGGGPPLGDFIGKSDALDDVEGSVGVNDEDYLEDSGVGWWFTNEYGFSGHIGREIQGIFYPSGTPPGGATGDVLFVPGKGGKGEIVNPIPDRHFVQDGVMAVRPQWHARIDAARSRFMGVARTAARAGVRP